MSNSNLNIAKGVKYDEFYTRLDDIAAELKYYDFTGLKVYCNCDTIESNFYQYFKKHFHSLNLKHLVATAYRQNDNGEIVEYDGETETTGVLRGNGDFRSTECIDLMNEADIIITNPPFSLFRTFIDTIMEYNKKFIVIGPLAGISCVSIFQYFRNDKMWLGRMVDYIGAMYFNVTKEYSDKMIAEGKEGTKYIIIDGKPAARVMASWYTNMDHGYERPMLSLTASYYENKEQYPLSDNNIHIINVDRTCAIPVDYSGIMRVPLTFIYKWNKEQFELVDVLKSIVNGKSMFIGLLIKNKLHPDYKPRNTLTDFIEESNDFTAINEK